MKIEKILEDLNVSEACFNDILKLVEEFINEVSKEVADEVTDKRNAARRGARDKYYTTRDSKDEEKYEEAVVKDYKNSELRDKWDVLKGIKRGKDKKFHSHQDYKEYKEKYDSK